MTAQEIRRLMRKKRKEAGVQDGAAVCAQILELSVYQMAHTVMAYAAIDGEVPLTAVMEDVLKTGRTLLLPRCEGLGIMYARRIKTLDELVPGAYGIMEPGEDCAIEENVDFVLVPGLAFDRRGGRIGYGGGYYDRFLSGKKAVRVGICADFALFERIPQTQEDRRMDCVVTPSETVHVQEEER